MRPYADADRGAVLAIFEANTPGFFGADERGWLEDSLDALDGPAFLVALGGEAVAFGGYEVWEYYDKALLVWGMAHPRVHGAGVGRWLLWARLARIARGDAGHLLGQRRHHAQGGARSSCGTGSRRPACGPAATARAGTLHELRFDLTATPAAALDAHAQAAYREASRRLLDART